MLPIRSALGGVVLVVVCCTLGAADPVPKPAEQVVGRWQGETKFIIKSNREGLKDEVFTRKVYLEFSKDGTLALTEGDIPELKDRLPNSAKGSTVRGKYVFVKDAEVEMTIEMDGKKMTDRARVSVTKDELSLAQIVQGKVQPAVTFKRPKD